MEGQDLDTDRTESNAGHNIRETKAIIAAFARHKLTADFPANLDTLQSCTTLESSFTKLVIALSLFRIAQYLVGFCRFLKLFFGFFVARVFIWVIFHGHLAVSLLDFGIACALVDTQYLIVIEICHVLSDVWMVFSFRSEKESAPYINKECHTWGNDGTRHSAEQKVRKRRRAMCGRGEMDFRRYWPTTTFA